MYQAACYMVYLLGCVTCAMFLYIVHVCILMHYLQWLAVLVLEKVRRRAALVLCCERCPRLRRPLCKVSLCLIENCLCVACLLFSH